MDIQYIDGMLWEIERVCKLGVKVPAHVRHAGRRVTSVTLTIERDQHRGRQTLVATAREGLPLFDVHVMPSVGDWWILSGYECQPDGCGRPQFTAQTWMMRPGAFADLEKADDLAKRLSREVAELKGIPNDVYVGGKPKGIRG